MTEPLTDSLAPLPAQPPGVPWPTERWPTGELELDGDTRRLLDEAFAEGGPIGETHALLVVKGGRLVYARYGGALPRFDRPPEPVEPGTRLLSWSMAKSMLHAVIGLLVLDGRLDPAEPIAAPQWGGPDDPRQAITVEHVLEMRDGLRFAEDYEDAGVSDVIEMLFGSGQDDVAAFAASRALEAEPGTRFQYSSGASNLLSGRVARLLGAGDPYRQFLSQRLFGPLGMSSAEPGFDAAGTWVASSTVHATAADYARFGLWYLRDGVWEDRRLLPEGWVDHGRRPRSVDPEDGTWHGAHWWAVDDDLGSFRAAGYEGQAIVISPLADQVVVRLGRTPRQLDEAWATWRGALVEALAACQAPS